MVVDFTFNGLRCKYDTDKKRITSHQGAEAHIQNVSPEMRNAALMASLVAKHNKQRQLKDQFL